MLYGTDVVDADILGVRASNLTRTGTVFMAPKPNLARDSVSVCAATATRRCGGYSWTYTNDAKRSATRVSSRPPPGVGGIAVIDEVAADEVTGHRRMAVCARRPLRRR
jgi:hypothetical protein